MRETISIFSERCHSWFDLLEYGTMCIFVYDNTCNDNCHSRENMIIHGACIKRWFHSSYHRDLWLFPFWFQLFFNFLFSFHYSSSSSAILFSSCDAYFLLSTTYVHCPSTCIGHCDFSMCCCTWEAFFIFSTHWSRCSFVTSWFMIHNIFLVYDLLFVSVRSFNLYFFHICFYWMFIVSFLPSS
jgi:hypothetical protein